MTAPWGTWMLLNLKPTNCSRVPSKPNSISELARSMLPLAILSSASSEEVITLDEIISEVNGVGVGEGGRVAVGDGVFEGVGVSVGVDVIVGV